MEEKIFNEEQHYLSDTINAVQFNIKKLDNSLNSSTKRLNSSNDEYFDYLKAYANRWSESDVQEITNMQSDLEYVSTNVEELQKEKNMYMSLLNKPYFARIDVTHNGEQDAYYIGKHSIIDDNHNFRVIDWRSPLASIFYDFEKGACNTFINDKLWKGNLDNKRQFGITNGQLDYYIDTTINIEDEILQQALAKNSSNKMQSIVETIQKEQNEIIRGDENSTLIVQGVAGSGKTAIALHRISYLLYKMQGKLKSENIVFLSPNNAFSCYISNVLPDLNEDDIKKIQLDIVAREYLKKHLILENKFEQVERLIDSNDAEYEYKMSKAFVDDLINFAQESYINKFKIDNFTLRTIDIDSSYIMRLFNKLSDKTLRDRFLLITENVFNKYFGGIKKAILKVEIKQEILNKLYSCLTAKNCVRAYMNFLDSKSMKLSLIGDKVKNEDAYGILFFKMFIYGLNKYSTIKHLVIDEMQDYSALQLYIINYLFDCPKTLLGDYNQSINPNIMEQNLNEALSIFDNSKIIKIDKSYRSTKEICDYCSSINGKTLQSVTRHGENVDNINIAKSKYISTLKDTIINYQNKGLKSIAVICKTNNSARTIFSYLSKYFPNISLIDDHKDDYDNGLCVISAYNSKGLEFDGVIVCELNDYITEKDKNIMYIACTRAMHKLTIIHKEK